MEIAKILGSKSKISCKSAMSSYLSVPNGPSSDMDKLKH